MSGLEDYPKPQKNNSKGEEEMTRPINPVHLKSLKEARKQLCEEGVVIEEGVADDEEKIIKRALDNEAGEIVRLKKVSGTFIDGSTLILPDLEANYRKIMEQLRKNPEEWETGGFTPAQRKDFSSVEMNKSTDTTNQAKKPKNYYDEKGNYIGPILTSAQAIFEAEEKRERDKEK